MYNTLDMIHYESQKISNSINSNFLLQESSSISIEDNLSYDYSFKTIEYNSTSFKQLFFQENTSYSFEEDESKMDEVLYERSVYKNTELKVTWIGSIPTNTKNKNSIFQVVYPLEEEKGTLFNYCEDNSSILEILDEKEEMMYIGRKRSSQRKERKENKDNIMKKIKCRFFNKALINNLNKKLKSNGSILYLMKFPQSFFCKIKKDKEKELLEKTLKEIFENKDLYENDLNNYYHNLKVINSNDINKNEEFEIIINKKYSQLFKEYINSSQFKIEDIKDIKQEMKEMKNDYLKRYIAQTKHFIEYFSQ